jgi:hypothetical protein
MSTCIRAQPGRNDPSRFPAVPVVDKEGALEPFGAIFGTNFAACAVVIVVEMR